MSFSRQIEPVTRLQGKALDEAMAGIGMNFAASAKTHLAIEDVLFFASRVGVEDEDYRVLSVLCQWIEVHASQINVDRLTRVVNECAEHELTRAFWAAVGQWQAKDKRFVRLGRLRSMRRRIDLFSAGTDFQIKRRGEHPWFQGTCLRLAANTLRSRKSDVAEPEALAALHAGYRERVVQGPSYRADMWAALRENVTLTPSELARMTYGSFASAWQVKRDWGIVHPR